MKHSLFSYEPDTYKKSQVMREILNAQEAQLLKEEEKQNGIVADMYPSQTIHPERWEKEYGIEPEKSLDERRKSIRAKMQGTGTVTVKMIREIIETYTDGTVTTKEDADDSMVHIEIESDTAIITNADVMEQAVYEIIPAHMDFICKYKRPLSGTMKQAMALQTTPVRNIGG